MAFNPLPAIQSWIDPRRQALLGLASGLVMGRDLGEGLGLGFARAAEGKRSDDAYATAKKEEAERQRQLNDTISFLQNSHPDLAGMVEAGLPLSEAWNEALRRGQPQQGVKPIEINGQLVDPETYEVLGDFRTPEAPKTPDYPTSYDEYQLAQQDPAYAASLNSSTSRPPTEGQRRNQQLATVVEPELKIVEDNWDDLTDAGNQMIGANTMLGAPGFALTSEGYQQATAALKTIAQSYLYSVSGAAATDAETQKIVDSVTPKFGESEASANDKKRRIRVMVEAVKAATGNGGATSGGSLKDKYGLE